MQLIACMRFLCLECPLYKYRMWVEVPKGSRVSRADGCSVRILLESWEASEIQPCAWLDPSSPSQSTLLPNPPFSRSPR